MSYHKKKNFNRQPSWKKVKKPREFRLCPLEVKVINGDIDQAIKVLDKKVSKDGVLSELKRRRFAEKPSEERRRKRREAIKKARRAANKRLKNSFRFKKRNKDGDQSKRKSTGADQRSGGQEE